ncbi:cation-transporting P-type ATPase [Sporomusa sp.]|uniref:cation-transporting P-type ATPase n=1 Tax=Sporomusa sp. TaxID=2078658 RepID=UPI002C535B73|nr:cation-transporting P-type ATPase [Sporomusa sp.]HWR45437.1 cation-transporting P-type ATPase [Sporomusa sp.]
MDSKTTLPIQRSVTTKGGYSMNILNKSLDEMYSELATSDQGLTAAEAKRRLDLYGHNVLGQQDTANAAIAFLRLF